MIDVNAEYQATLDYLYTFVDFSLTRNFQYSPKTFNLDRMQMLLAQLDDPHRSCPVIHVAGTKGKGSTAAMIASVLQVAGYTVGVYTSPHLEDFCERIQVDGKPILPAELVAMVKQLKPTVESLHQPATFFEWTTALAFQYFAQRRCTAMVIEVGLGGRLDSTNVVDPLVSVITSLSMDHMAVLGDTLEKIAWEKAGIIKPGRPVVSAPQQQDAADVILSVAKERVCSLTQVGKDVLYRMLEHDLDGQDCLVWQTNEQLLVDNYFEGGELMPGPLRLRIPLLGSHQAQNAATTAAALIVADQEGLVVSPDAMRVGMARVRWPGRFEILQREPFLVIDSAHNRDSARCLRQTLDDYFPGRPVTLLFGASADKDIAGMFTELLPRIRRVVATQSIHPRAAAVEDLIALANRFGCPDSRAILPLEDALSAVLEFGRTDGSIVLAAGSLFVAGAVRSIWSKTKVKN
jgi:dihydrofolate synthase / folylpolyglutamate synthase